MTNYMKKIKEAYNSFKEMRDDWKKKRAKVDYETINSIVEEMNPIVIKKTGMDTKIEDMEIKILEHRSQYEDVCRSNAKTLGIDYEKQKEKNWLKNTINSQIRSSMVLGAYDGLENKMYFIKENCENITQAELKGLVGHELIHRAQHVNYPGLFEKIWSVDKELAKEDKSSEKYKQLTDDRTILRFFIELEPTMFQVEDLLNRGLESAAIYSGLKQVLKPSVLVAALMNKNNKLKRQKNNEKLKKLFVGNNSDNLKEYYASPDKILEVVKDFDANGQHL